MWNYLQGWTRWMFLRQAGRTVKLCGTQLEHTAVLLLAIVNTMRRNGIIKYSKVKLGLSLQYFHSAAAHGMTLDDTRKRIYLQLVPKRQNFSRVGAKSNNLVGLSVTFVRFFILSILSSSIFPGLPHLV